MCRFRGLEPCLKEKLFTGLMALRRAVIGDDTVPVIYRTDMSLFGPLVPLTNSYDEPPDLF